MTSTISVIIPTRNRIATIGRALESVFLQTLQPTEVIVVDDHSDDGTQAYLLAKYPNVRVIRNEIAAGGAGARNQGVRAASGFWLAFLDSDDEWLPDHLERQIARMERLNAKFGFGSFFLVADSTTPIQFVDADLSKQKVGDLILSNDRFDARTSTFVVARQVFDIVCFDETLKKHQDWDLAIEIQASGFATMVDYVPTTRIYVNTSSGRMSHSLQHDSTFRFIEKHRNRVNPNNMFIFVVKMLFRSFRDNPNTPAHEAYFEVLKRLRRLNLQNTIACWLIVNRIISPDRLYRLKKILYT